MTRRLIVFVTKEGNAFASPEFNGDKYEFELFGMKDKCFKDWEDIIKMFSDVKTVVDFNEACIKAAKCYQSHLSTAKASEDPIFHKYNPEEEAGSVDYVIYLYEKDDNGKVVVPVIPDYRKAELFDILLSLVKDIGKIEEPIETFLSFGFSGEELELLNF